jgi:hypothetical protein
MVPPALSNNKLTDEHQLIELDKTDIPQQSWQADAAGYTPQTRMRYSESKNER